jgi:hypothetical protein
MSTSSNTATKVKNTLTSATTKVTDTLKNLTTQDATSPQSPLFWFLIVAGVAFLIFCIQMIMKANSNVATPTNIATVNADQLALFQTKFASEFKDKKTLRQAIQEQSVSDLENCLINFQPLTVIYPGFLGPLQNGVFNENEGVKTVLRMGARCFVLPIDYHDKDTMPASFPPANKPCLMYRDEGGTVRSLNGGNIRPVAQAIADVAWSDLVIQKNDPFILVLYFVNTPEQGTREYLNFLSQVAIDLEPLSPYLLGQTPEGVYNRQAKQNDLFYVNTNQLDKKLLVLCNADTSGFRTSQKDFNRTFLPKEDLDYWTHMRIFKQNADTLLGVTTMPERNVMPKSIVDTTAYYVSLPTDPANKRTAINGTKEKFMITLSPNGTNPSSSTTTMALDTYGVQCVPLFLVEYSPETQALLRQWKYAWKAKPKEIRYVRPEPIEILPQSGSVNANGGSLTIPSA